MNGGGGGGVNTEKIEEMCLDLQLLPCCTHHFCTAMAELCSNSSIFVK